MSTFDEPDGVQGWESDGKSVFGQRLDRVEEVDFFQKLGLALGLGLALQVVKMFTFDEPDGVQVWESDEKVFLDKVWAPKC